MAGTPVYRVSESAPDSSPDNVRLSLNALINDYAIGKNGTTASAAIGTATDPTKVKSTIATAGTINGAAVGSKAPTDPEWALGGALSKTPVPTGYTQKYVLTRDINNTPGVQEGRPALTATIATAPVVFPTLDAANLMIVGVLTIVNTSGNPFIPGTTSLAAAGIAATYTQQATDPALGFRAWQVFKLQ